MTDLPFAIDGHGRTWGPRELSWAWLRPPVHAPADVTFTVNGTPLGGDRYTFETAMGGPARRYPGDGNRHERRKAAAERRRGR